MNKGKQLTLGYTALAFLMLMVASIRWLVFGYEYNHPDEIIAVKVIEVMVHAGSFDTNWINADLPSYFKYNQYNFSGYLIFGSGIVWFVNNLFGVGNISTIEVLRLISFIFGMGIVYLVFVLGKNLYSPFVGVVSALLVSATPILSQDALYARPESFLTFLTLVFLIVIFSSKQTVGKVLISSAILGFMVSIKISSVIISPILAFYIYLVARDKNNYFVLYLSAGIFFILGFFVGAPYAMINLDAYISGIKYLANQYASGHWPHGLPQGRLYEKLLYSLDYIYSSFGVIFFVFFFLGLVKVVREKNKLILLTFLTFLLLYFYFSVKPVFFERNFSHVLPFFIVVASLGVINLYSFSKSTKKNKPIILVVFILLVFFLLYKPFLNIYKLYFIELTGQSKIELSKVRASVENKYGVNAFLLPWINNIGQLNMLDDYCSPYLLEFSFTGDSAAKNVMKNLSSKGFEEVAVNYSSFLDFPPCTLHTYFLPTKVFLYRNSEKNKCKGLLSFVSKSVIDQEIGFDIVIQDANWTKQGSYPSSKDDVIQNNFYGSWSGSDGYVGNMSVKVQLNWKSFILPYKTGPISSRQKIEVLDDNGQVIWSVDTLPKAENWRFLRVDLPHQKNDKVEIRFLDAGDMWGEWLAFAHPFSLKDKNSE